MVTGQSSGCFTHISSLRQTRELWVLSVTPNSPPSPSSSPKVFLRASGLFFTLDLRLLSSFLGIGTETEFCRSLQYHPCALAASRSSVLPSFSCDCLPAVPLKPSPSRGCTSTAAHCALPDRYEVAKAWALGLRPDDRPTATVVHCHKNPSQSMLGGPKIEAGLSRLWPARETFRLSKFCGGR